MYTTQAARDAQALGWSKADCDRIEELTEQTAQWYWDNGLQIAASRVMNAPLDLNI